MVYLKFFVVSVLKNSSKHAIDRLSNSKLIRNENDVNPVRNGVER